MAMSSQTGSNHGCKNVNNRPKSNDPRNTYQPRVVDEPMLIEDSQIAYKMSVDDELKKSVKDLIPSWAEDINITMAFNELVTSDPTRHKELLEAVNKTFEETSNSISPTEFQNMLGDLSFLKNKKNVENLYSTLKSQFNTHMSTNFEKVIVDENVSELFTEKTVLSENEKKKYSIDDTLRDIIDMEQSLVKLNSKIIQLEETNDVFFNRTKFNKQRHDQISERLVNLLDKCEVTYAGNVEQTEAIRKEVFTILQEQ